MVAGTIVAICLFGGEFVSKHDGTTSYTGGEAHAINIKRDMPFNDLKSEIASMFDIDSSSMSIKYFLPINKQTLITISSDKDLERMIDFNENSLTIDIYVSNNVDNRTTRSIAADSGTSIVDTAAADHNLRSWRPTTAKKISKRATRGRISVADSSAPEVTAGTIAGNVKHWKPKAAEKNNIRIVAYDSVAPVATASKIEINREERLESDTADKIDNNREVGNIIDEPNPHACVTVDTVYDIVPQHATNPWMVLSRMLGKNLTT